MDDDDDDAVDGFIGPVRRSARAIVATNDASHFDRSGYERENCSTKCQWIIAIETLNSPNVTSHCQIEESWVDFDGRQCDRPFVIFAFSSHLVLVLRNSEHQKTRLVQFRSTRLKAIVRHHRLSPGA
jgi:hypothetical protein